jgi:hypothetical protein
MKLSNEELIVLLGVFDLAKEYAGDLNHDEKQLQNRILKQLKNKLVVNK